MNMNSAKVLICVIFASALVIAGCTTDSDSKQSSNLHSTNSDNNASGVSHGNAGSGNTGVRGHFDENQIAAGNNVELLLDGPETYDAMFAAIEGAQDHVNLETFILADDDIGQRLAQTLARRVKDGITVNLLYDAIGSSSTDKSYFDRLQQSGINLLAYEPLLETEPTDWHNRNHRKVLIIDGTIGFTGGLNFTDDYRFSSRSGGADKRFGDGWRDTHLKIQGPAVAIMQKSFLKIWKDTAEGVPVEWADYFPVIEPAGNQDVVIVTARGDDEFGSRIIEQHKLAINAANSRVWITQAYFAPPDEIIECLKNAAKRGVDVRLLLPGETDVELAAFAASANYEDLIGSGVRIFEFRGAILHAKTALIDNHWSTVGSSNFDILSMEFNNELNAIVLDEEFTDELAQAFIADLQRATEITQAVWDERSLWTKMKHGVAKFVQGGM